MVSSPPVSSLQLITVLARFIFQFYPYADRRSAHLFSLSLSLLGTLRAIGRKRRFSERLSPFSCPYYRRNGATSLFSTANNTTRPVAPPLRPSAFGAFNLRVHHRAGQEQVQADIERERERDAEWGWKRDGAERKKKRESERGSREEQGGRCCWSERENRRSDGGTERSLPSLPASACSLRRTPGIVCFQHAHTCVNQSNHLITNNLLVLLFSSLAFYRSPRLAQAAWQGPLCSKAISRPR